ncbi:DUF4230 domain-containing protein [Patescibacteria group bacterium]|nr:DUF4230 domain-containing protein [Patescibacteria group bacterium]MBU1028804.1 DUF4230 domain-containing protein [Patescibacteria group bacterium]MBU1915835.1 DUF4230 domain-containing protein [Patescibacteria group bacterium]
MNKLKGYLYTTGFAALAISVLILTIKFGLLGQKSQEEQVTSRAILERIADNYFVVTKSVIVYEEVEINIDKGSTWSNLLWGQTVKARGTVRLDIGVDLAGLDENDININHRVKTVSLSVPRAEILNASQYGAIEVDSRQGVLKWLTDNDPNDDHNRALDQLLREARTSILTDEQLFNEARNDAAKLLELIVESFDYSLVITQFEAEETQ